MNNNTADKEFAMIGGGSVGPIVLIYLAKMFSETGASLSGYTFHPIDPRGYGNGGIAYGQSAANHILNTLRNEMSPWDRDAFHNYLLSIGRDDDHLQFALRSDYKDFLTIEFAKARANLEVLGAQFLDLLLHCTIS
jgi:uncharacterized NAD(P)/FAD-binding protein YdhS